MMSEYVDWREIDELENFANAYRSWLTRTMHGENHTILFDILYETEFMQKYEPEFVRKYEPEFE